MTETATRSRIGGAPALLVALVLALAATAEAQSPPAAMPRPRPVLLALLLIALVVAPAAPAGAEAFFALYVGKSFTQVSDLKIRQPSQQSDFTFSGVSFEDRSFENPLYYGGRGGYSFEAVPWFGFAMEFFHFKMFADTRA